MQQWTMEILSSEQRLAERIGCFVVYFDLQEQGHDLKIVCTDGRVEPKPGDLPLFHDTTTRSLCTVCTVYLYIIATARYLQMQECGDKAIYYLLATFFVLYCVQAPPTHTA